MALKYGFSKKREGNKTTYTDRSGKSVNKSTATSSRRRSSRGSSASEVIVRDEEGVVTNSSDKSLIGKKLTTEESKAISSGDVSLTDVERERSVSKTRQNIAQSKFLTSIEKGELQNTPTDTPQGKAIQESVSKSYTKYNIAKSKDATAQAQAQAEQVKIQKEQAKKNRYFDVRTQTFFPDEPGKTAYLMSARKDDTFQNRPEPEKKTLATSIKKGYQATNTFLSEKVTTPLGIGRDETEWINKEKAGLKHEVEYWQLKVKETKDQPVKNFWAKGGLGFAQFGRVTGTFILGAEKQVREEVRERPVGVAIKYGIGYGVGKVVGVVSKLGAYGATAVKASGKVAGGLYTYSVAKETLKAPTLGTKGEVAGRTIVDLGAFMAGAKFAQPRANKISTKTKDVTKYLKDKRIPVREVTKAKMQLETGKSNILGYTDSTEVVLLKNSKLYPKSFNKALTLRHEAVHVKFEDPVKGTSFLARNFPKTRHFLIEARADLGAKIKSTKFTLDSKTQEASLRSNQPPRKIIGEIKTTSLSKSTVKTEGGKFNIKQNIPSPKPAVKQIVEFREAKIGKFLPKTKVRLEISGKTVTESRTFLGKTSQFQYKYNPNDYLSVKSIETASQTTRKPVKYSNEKTIAKQQIRSDSEYEIKNINLKGKTVKSTVVKQKDTGGFYRVEAQKGYGVEVYNKEGLTARMIGRESNLVELGQSKIKISNKPLIHEENVLSRLTGKGVGEVSQTLTTKAPSSTVKTIYQASTTTISPKTPVKDFVKQIPVTSGQMLRSKVARTSLVQVPSYENVQRVQLTQPTPGSDIIPKDILNIKSPLLVGILGVQSLGGTKIGSPSLALTNRISPIIQQEPKQDIRPIVDTVQVQRAIQIPIQQARERTVQKVVQRTIQIPVQKIIQKQTTKQAQVVQQIFQPITTRVGQFRTPPETPIIQTRTQPKTKKPKMFAGYDVYTRRFGKVVKLNRLALSEGEAEAFGKYKIGRSARASFTLKKSTSKGIGRFRSKGINTDFYKNEEGWWVEKRGRRIKSGGEIREITLKGKRAISRKKKTRNIFGF